MIVTDAEKFGHDFMFTKIYGILDNNFTSYLLELIETNKNIIYTRLRDILPSQSTNRLVLPLELYQASMNSSAVETSAPVFYTVDIELLQAKCSSLTTVSAKKIAMSLPNTPEAQFVDISHDGRYPEHELSQND